MHEIRRRNAPIFRFFRPLGNNTITDRIRGGFALCILDGGFLFQVGYRLAPRSLRYFYHGPGSYHVVICIVQKVFVAATRAGRPGLLSSFARSVLLFLFSEFCTGGRYYLFYFGLIHSGGPLLLRYPPRNPRPGFLEGSGP